MTPTASAQYPEARLPNIPLPRARFTPHEELTACLRPVWAALHAGHYHLAYERAKAMPPIENRSNEERPALLAALAAAELRLGRVAASERTAGQSLQLCPPQMLARLVLLEARVNLRDYTGADGLLAALEGPGTSLPWDEPLPPQDLLIARASLAWRLRQWETVAALVEQAYPGGIEMMPLWLLEDFFRLALYRNRPEDAAAAAALLIRARPEESTDALLQTLVQQGWTEHALPLYRTAFSDAPRSALLRRRLVALCLREGAVEEARALAQSSALEVTHRKDQ